jgi:hypothetical protein
VLRKGVRIILSAGHADGSLVAYCVKDGVPVMLQRVQMHRSAVTCMAVIREGDNMTLVTGGCDGTVRIWDLSQVRVWRHESLCIVACVLHELAGVVGGKNLHCQVDMARWCCAHAVFARNRLARLLGNAFTIMFVPRMAKGRLY